MALYQKYLQEELDGNSSLHIEKVFLTKLGISCHCGANEVPLSTTDITYHINSLTGSITQQTPKNNEYPDKRKYVYYDNTKSPHNLGIFSILLSKKIRSDEYPIADENGMIELIDAREFKGYSSGSLKAGFKTWNSPNKRWYLNPDCLAGILGAMLDCNIDYLGFNGGSQRDGSPSPSKSHRNGVCLDVQYLSKNKNGEPMLLQSPQFDYDGQELFNKALYKYGWGKGSKGSMCSEVFNYNGKMIMLFKAVEVKKPPHNDHLHIGGFDFNGIIKTKEK